MKQYASQLLRYPEMGISLDLSKLPLTPEFLSGMQPLIDRAYAHCTKILQDNIEKLAEVAKYLLENENMSREEFEAVMQNKEEEA